ncbi:sodium:solute symporter family protein [Youngiibacter fragilis]|uniref:Sodium:solute symporter n=1 Tax=Youngiibacter fragilis 232.1 TaxID=994573 RepID=V7ICD6_9CLOT|nr:sodium:solute symporter family protein [Youngiibacter fragilis]ETA82532.1 hypothetical protein T472_0200415 [Youngiibacter fragilis 232.1]
MDKNLIALIIVVTYFIGLFVIAAIANKIQAARAKKLNKEGAEGFLMASRSMGLPLVMTTIMGVAIGANATTGAAQGGYLYGFAAGTHPLWLGLSVTLVGLLLASKYRRMRMLTVSQLYGDAYGETTRMVATVGQIFMNFVIMVSQFIAGGTILATLLPQYFTVQSGMILSAIIFLLIAVFGGWMSCGATNILNMVMCYLAVGLGIYTVFSNPDIGGWTGIVNNLPDRAKYLSPVSGIGWSIWLVYPVLMFFNVAGHQSQVQCITTAKDEKTAKYGFIIGGLLVAPIGYLCAIIGMGALKLYPNLPNSAMAMPMFIVSMPGVLAGLSLAGLWAASVSTATNLSISASTMFVNDILKPAAARRGKKLSAQAELRAGITGIVVFTAVSCFAAFFVKVLLSFVGAGLALSVPFGIIILTTIYLPKLAKSKTAMVLMITSYVAMVVWVLNSKVLAKTFLHPVWFMLIVTIIALVAVTLIDKNPAYFRTQAYRDKYGSMYDEGTKEYIAEMEEVARVASLAKESI